jgi:hypothetical protein
MSEEDIKIICRKIVRYIVDRLEIAVEEDVIERIAEGLVNSIRAVSFLSLARANDLWGRLERVGRRWGRYNLFLNLRGKWFPVTSEDVYKVIQHDLQIRGFLRRITPTEDHIHLAKSLENEFKLSNHVERILFTYNVEWDLSASSIALEASLLDQLRKRLGRKITVDDVEDFEDDIGKWFG